jgi:hypothetical protein
MKHTKFLSLFLALIFLVGCSAADSTSDPPTTNSPALGNAVLPEHLSSDLEPNPTGLSQSGAGETVSGYVWELGSFSCSSHIENARLLSADDADGFYVLGAAEDGETLYTVYHCTGSGEIQSQTTLPIHGDQQTSVGNSGIVCGTDTIWFDYTVTVSAGGGDQQGDYSYYLAACDYNGNLLFSALREEIIPSDQDASSLTGMALYDSACVVATEHDVFALDAGGTILWQSTTDRSLYQMCPGADGALYFMTYADGDDLLKLDGTTHEIGSALFSLSDGMYSLHPGILGYDLLLEDAQGDTPQIYGLDAASGEKTLIFDLGALGILTIGNIVETGNRRLVLDYFSLMGSAALGQLVQAPVSAETITLSLGVCGSLSAAAESAVETFNRQHTDAYLSIRQYDSTDALNLAIVSGEGPDIICFDGLCEEDYARNGSLCDLYTLLGSDMKAQLVAQYRQEYETDGKLYRIAPVFCCETMIGNREYVTEDARSFAAMLAAARTVSSDCRIFSQEPADCLQTLLQRSITKFVDFDSYTCDFENEAFEALLSLSALGTKAPEEQDGQSWLYEIRTENLMDYNSDGTGASDSVLGFPDTAILSTQPGDTFGVSVRSAHPELAGEFIALLLSEDMQRGYSDLTGYYPILRTVYESIVPAQLQSEVSAASGHYIAISPVYDIIADEAAAFFSGDQTAAQAAAHIQSRVSIYLGEHS